MLLVCPFMLPAWRLGEQSWTHFCKELFLDIAWLGELNGLGTGAYGGAEFGTGYHYMNALGDATPLS